ncbi:MAG: cupin domain-containing protein [Solirubrobacteraceae bacterium]
MNVGVRRIELPSGSWSTPAHEHRGAEELFYVLAGRGLLWQKGTTTDIGAGDCIAYLARRGADTLHALEPLDVLAFGPRVYDEALRFPRLGMSLVGGRLAETTPGVLDGAPAQFVHESALGPPELPPEPGPRPSTVVHLAMPAASARSPMPPTMAPHA